MSRSSPVGPWHISFRCFLRLQMLPVTFTLQVSLNNGLSESSRRRQYHCLVSKQAVGRIASLTCPNTVVLLHKFCLPLTTHSNLWLFLDESCGGVFEDGSGSFTSPNYPSFYGDNLKCMWLLYRTTESVEFILTDMNTQSNYDFLVIRSGR